MPLHSVLPAVSYTHLDVYKETDAQVRAAECVPDADLNLVVNIRNQGSGVDARCQLAFTKKLRVDGYIRIRRVHVLSTGNTE